LPELDIVCKLCNCTQGFTYVMPYW